VYILIMDRHTIQILEYEKVLAIIARYASTEAGRSRILAAQPLDERSHITNRLGMVSEAKSLAEWGDSLPIEGVHEIGDSISRSRVPGAVLDAASLLRIGSSARAARIVRGFLEGKKEEAARLWRLASNLRVLKELEDRIDSAIDEDTNIKDDASSGLKRIRREKARVSARISASLSDILARENLRPHLRESLVTIRNGRYVIPVRAEAKAKIEGIVHDTSQSGATVFIEPMATVELNNTLRSLELEEKDEILRILARLTDVVRASAGDLAVNLEVLTELDVVNAGSRFSRDFSCIEPGLSDDGRTILKGARHPLLIDTQRGKGGDGVVPLDIALGGNQQGVLITGPNAGGKTVALKTVGILTLLVRTGFHIPCDDGTSVALFTKVYADIGDEQSIELSLSTFTSHMKNIIAILDNADGNSLILLDEVGAGTDPSEGSALARTVIEELLDKGATLVATTHHMTLKVFAHDNPRLENASMEFDPEGLRPTYRLIQGMPGASHAFEIAARLGMEDRMLARARDYCGAQEVRFEELTRDLLERMRRLAMEEAGVEAKSKRADDMLAEYEAKLDEIRRYDRQIKKEALKEARTYVDEARRKATEIVRELKRPRIGPEEARVVEKRMRQESAEIGEKIEELEAAESPRQRLSKIEVGARAHIRPLDREGVVLTEPDGRGRVEVVVGAMRVEVEAADLFEPDGRGAKPRAGSVEFETKEVPREIEVRGMTSEEAWETVDKYIDDAALGGHMVVRIIHGKGKGVLAKKIRDMLASHPRVKSYRFADPGEGGTGVTVIEIEQG
jgi:DNA mismatch repair protein MutS2